MGADSIAWSRVDPDPRTPANHRVAKSRAFINFFLLQSSLTSLSPHPAQVHSGSVPRRAPPASASPPDLVAPGSPTRPPAKP
uniref:Uncharacterized protein n=1 Tax=Aegilops tauschii subsp. strangulata TaxID=200361 RepID=A0A453M4L2_AEGTS